MQKSGLLIVLLFGFLFGCSPLQKQQLHTYKNYPNFYPKTRKLLKLEIPYGNNVEIGKYADVNESKLYYEIYGSGTPVFLIHGNGSSSTDMKYQAESLKQKYQVIIVDSRAHGKSEINTDSLTYDLMAKDYIALSEHLGIKKAHYFGWSDGANIALKVAGFKPEMVKSVFAFAAVLSPESVQNFSKESMILESKTLKSEIQKKGINQERNRKLQHLILTTYQPNAEKMQLELKKITCPVLVVAGQYDLVKEKETKEIHKLIKNSELMILQNATHFAPVYQYEIINELTKQFFEKND